MITFIYIHIYIDRYTHIYIYITFDVYICIIFDRLSHYKFFKVKSRLESVEPYA